LSVIDRMFARANQTQSSVLVGLDPLVAKLPAKFSAKGLHGAAQGILDFNLEILEAVHDLIPAVKLQMACYELYGPEGIRSFEKTVQRAKELGLFVIDDSKRGDIGSTATLYAQARIGVPPLFEGDAAAQGSDFVTVNPYLGDDGLTPFYDTALSQDKGVFVLVRTSNPSSAQYQTAQINGMPLYEQIGLDVQAKAVEHQGKCGYAPFGAVVGATWPEEAVKLRALMPNVPFLVPGYGSQGGRGKDVVPCFDAQGSGALINSSRGILFAYQSQGAPESQFASCAREAVVAMNDDINSALEAAGKTAWAV